MTFVGIWACQRRELAPITFGLGLGLADPSESAAGSDGATQAAQSGESQPPDSLGDDLENGMPGFSRGRRGRNREEYEMVPMKEEGHTS